MERPRVTVIDVAFVKESLLHTYFNFSELPVEGRCGSVECRSGKRLAENLQCHHSDQRFHPESIGCEGGGGGRVGERTRERGWEGSFYCYLLFSEPGTEQIFIFAFKVT